MKTNGKFSLTAIAFIVLGGAAMLSFGNSERNIKEFAIDNISDIEHASTDDLQTNPGDFYVDNQTNCTYTIVLFHTAATCGGGCPGTRVTATNQATANTTTLVDNGSAYPSSNSWNEIEVLISGYPGLSDGFCSSAGTGPTCSGSDISVTWIDCRNAVIQ